MIDLDETLVHSSFTMITNADFTLKVRKFREKMFDHLRLNFRIDHSVEYAIYGVREKATWLRVFLGGA